MRRRTDRPCDPHGMIHERLGVETDRQPEGFAHERQQHEGARYETGTVNRGQERDCQSVQVATDVPVKFAAKTLRIVESGDRDRDIGRAGRRLRNLAAESHGFRLPDCVAQFRV